MPLQPSEESRWTASVISRCIQAVSERWSHIGLQIVHRCCPCSPRQPLSDPLCRPSGLILALEKCIQAHWRNTKSWVFCTEFLLDLENYMVPLGNSFTFCDVLSAPNVVCSVCLRYSIEGIVWPRWLWLKGEVCRARVVLKEAAGGRGRAGFRKGLPQSTGRLRIVQVL